MPKAVRPLALLVVLSLGLNGVRAAEAPATAGAIPQGLSEYVHKPDDSYSYKIVETAKIGTTRGYVVHLTSQTWEGIVWHHWLSILVPAKINPGHKAILAIVGGRNTDKPPKYEGGTAMLLAGIAEQCEAPMAILQQVPNEPLFDDLREDGLISYTFEKYLDGGNKNWPLLLPMVKSAVRAMDTTQAVLKDQAHLDIKQFLVTGASKRGWTTWLTAAVDPRVAGIAPMVIDMLNMKAQLGRQLASYGTFSEQIKDYTDRNILKRMIDSVRGEKLGALVDPYTYRSLFTMPKLILLGTNDPYWTVDAANLYFGALPGVSLLHYEPNIGHSAGPGTISTLIAFMRAMLNGTALPQLNWQRHPNGTLNVAWKGQTATAKLWQAHSTTRDFREAAWTGRALEGKDSCTVKLEAPASGWTAYFVQVTFAGTPPMMLSTEMTVLPKTFPHEKVAENFAK